MRDKKPAANEDGSPGQDDWPEPSGSDNSGDALEDHPESRFRMRKRTRENWSRVSHAKRREPRPR